MHPYNKDNNWDKTNQQSNSKTGFKIFADKLKKQISIGFNEKIQEVLSINNKIFIDKLDFRILF